MTEGGLGGRTVALLEARRSAELATLVERHGGRPRVVPALREVEAVDPAALAAIVAEIAQHGLRVAIFQTGVGTEALLRRLAEMGDESEQTVRVALERATVVVRGPKPTVVLRHAGIRIDLSAAAPFTTEEVLSLLDPFELGGQRALVQHYGGPNEQLVGYLAGRGATVLEAVLYRWALPEDTEPVLRLIADLEAGAVDAVAFTSASQVHNLFVLADQLGGAAALREALEHRTVVAAVGPVCAAALAEHDVRPPGGLVQPENPKMVPLVNALAAHFASRPEPR